MPAVTSGKVLVSGASGFIAAWVAKDLLEKGFTVRGTVRSKSKGEYLKNLFSNYGDKFEYVIVEDIEKDGAFDEAVKGMDAVEHTASPFHLKADDPNELIGPAVQGTVGMLKSVSKNGPTVKRVVITSSCASVVNPGETTTGPLNESSWNENSPKEVKEKGKNATNLHKYRASKVMAERAAWDYVKTGTHNFDFVVINPPFVFGPIIHEVPSVESLNTSINNVHTVLQGKTSNESLATSGGCWVDVRDVATAHANALTVPAAGGNRVIVSTGAFCMQDVLDVLNEAGLDNIPKGNPGAGKSVKHPVTYDSSLAKQLLGIKFITLDQSMKDTVVELRKRGW